MHLQRLSERIGEDWAEIRDQEVELFRKGQLPRTYQAPPQGAAAVMLDGGRVQTRAEDSGRGVTQRRWRETKVACCLTLQTKAQGTDPKPEPPPKFLEPTQVSRLASDIKRRRGQAAERDADKGNADKGNADKGNADKGNAEKGDEASAAKKKKKKHAKRAPKRRPRRACSRIRVRTVVATMENSETFGWQVAAEVHRRGLDQMKRKACVCDGQAYNWSIFEMHLLPLGFVAVLDFVHLLAYLYDAAHAWRGSDAARGWKTYEQWLRWAWSGKTAALLSGMRTALADARSQGQASRAAVIEEALTYATNNRQRMDYPEYRRLGLPISSAPVESTIKQINRRVKGTEKFWLERGAEAMLQLRAAQLSQDDRWTKNWSRPRKHRRASNSTSSCLSQAA